MSSSIRRPFAPIISSIQYREGTVCRVKKLKILYEKCRDLDPSLRFLENTHRSPEDDSMMNSECSEIFIRRLSIDLLDNHTVDIPYDFPCTQKLISPSSSVNQETLIFLIVVKKYLRTRSIIAEVFGNVLSKYCFHFL